jgi:hypothetical protein
MPRESQSHSPELRTVLPPQFPSIRRFRDLARSARAAWLSVRHLYRRRALMPARSVIAVLLIGSCLSLAACGGLPTQVDATVSATPVPTGPRLTCESNQTDRSSITGARMGRVPAPYLAPTGPRHDCTTVITAFGSFDVDWGDFSPGGDNADWGNDYGDGSGFLGWDGEFPEGDDQFALAAESDAECPWCRIIDIATRLAEDPEIEEEAAAELEAVEGFSVRIVSALKDVGARLQGQWHHIATDKNYVSGQQWSVQFENIFSQFGMNLSSAENKVYVIDHFGPHPQEYHQAVFDFLSQASSRSDLESRLYQLGQQASTPGTYLNSLLTTRGVNAQ